jgi:outer membrane receptor protein involved in Fe transport
LARPGNRNSRQLKADMTHYVSDSPIGVHELKMGGSYDWLINTEFREWLAGARLHQLFNGAPNRIVLSNAPVTQNGNVDQWNLYVQDQWNVASRLTLQLGLRFESVEGWFPEGSVGGVNFPVESFAAQHDVVTFRYLAPRLGFAYDPAGNRKTVLKGSYGRYYNQLYTGEFSGARPYTFGNQTYNWTDRNGDLVWQPGEEGSLLSDNRVPGLGSIDAALDPSYVTAWILGVERELGRVFAVSAQFIRKDEYDMAETLDTAAPFDEAYAHAPVTNPVSGEPMTIYPLLRSYQGVPAVRFYTNPGPWTCSYCPALERKYRGVELSFRRNLSSNWQFFGSYVYGRSEGNKGTGHGGNTVFANPNNFIRTGGLTYDIPHQVKLYGTYQLPFGIVTSASYTGLAGTPWARTAQFTNRDTPLIVVETAIEVPVEEVGEQRFDWTHELSLRAEKRFLLGSRRYLGFVVDMFNSFNNNTVTAIQNTRIDHPNFNKPATIMLPRTIRLGARFNF